MKRFEALNFSQDSEFEFVKGKILSIDGLPSLEQIYSNVQSEDIRRKATSNPSLPKLIIQPVQLLLKI